MRNEPGHPGGDIVVICHSFFGYCFSTSLMCLKGTYIFLITFFLQQFFICKKRNPYFPIIYVALVSVCSLPLTFGPGVPCKPHL